MKNNTIKPTIMNIKKKAKECYSKKEFYQTYPVLYKEAKKKNQRSPGFYEEICKHMEKRNYLIRTKRYSRGQIQLEAKNFTNRSDFSLYKQGAYRAALLIDRNEPGFMDKICNHMIKKTSRPKGFWTKERILKEIKKYNSLQDFRINGFGAYSSLTKKRNGSDKKLYEFVLNYYKKKSKTKEKREFKAQKKFHEQIKKYLIKLDSNYLLHKEYTIPKKDSIKGRVDFFIKLPKYNICFAIEFKHDRSQWSQPKLKKQLKKYNRCLRDRKGFIETFLISTKGKYGISEDVFLNKILPQLLDSKG